MSVGSVHGAVGVWAGFLGGTKCRAPSSGLAVFDTPPSLPLLVTARRVVVWDCHVVSTMCLVVTRGRFRLCAFCSSSPQWPHQAHHGPGHPVECFRNCRHQRVDDVRNVSRRPEADARHQAAVPGHDHQERTCGRAVCAVVVWVAVTRSFGGASKLCVLPLARYVVPSGVHGCAVCGATSLQLKKYFTFEVTVLDDNNVHRRFRASNYQVRLRVFFLAFLPRQQNSAVRGMRARVLSPCTCVAAAAG